MMVAIFRIQVSVFEPLTVDLTLKFSLQKCSAMILIFLKAKIISILATRFFKTVVTNVESGTKSSPDGLTNFR